MWICSCFGEGRTGDEVFHASVTKAAAEGLRPMLYSHPVGLYGHGAGPSFGLYDCQGDVPGTGALQIHGNTCYALELNTTDPVPEWDGQDVCFMLEETILFRGSSHGSGTEEYAVEFAGENGGAERRHIAVI